MLRNRRALVTGFVAQTGIGDAAAVGHAAVCVALWQALGARY